MYKISNCTFTGFVATLSLWLCACSGGSSSDNHVSGIDGSGSPMTSVSGPVSGFGSVIVNGVRYHTNKAIFLVNDQAGTEDDLHAGYQVHITGTLNTDGTGEATTIEFHSNIVGTISAINIQTNQLTLLGQNVSITNSTLFSANISPNFIDGLKVGDNVQVSGQINNQGVVIASRVDLINNSTQQILGEIKNLDETNFTFMINNLIVNYSSASLTNVTNNNLKNGVHVFINGSLNGSGILIAQTIKQLEDTLRSGSKNAEVDGFITRFVSATDFSIGDVSCITNTQTTYEGGTKDLLALGAQLEIEGSINGDGKLVATKVQFHQHETKAIAGNVTTISANTSGAIIIGILSVSGVDVHTDVLTRVEDKSSTQLKKFNVGDIHISDFVKISGYDSSNGFIATYIERVDLQTDDPLKIEGVVTSVRADGFNINDRSIALTDQTELYAADNTALIRANFLTAALGVNVEVRGILHSGVFTATRVQIKNID